MFARKSIFSAGRACLRKRMQAAAARNGGIQGPVSPHSWPLQLASSLGTPCQPRKLISARILYMEMIFAAGMVRRARERRPVRACKERRFFAVAYNQQFHL